MSASESSQTLGLLSFLSVHRPPGLGTSSTHIAPINFGSMASSAVWSDFETLRHNVKLNTVDRLKQILSGFNDECHTNFTKSGKKQELIDRITRELDLWRRSNSTDKWIKGKAILNQVRTSGMYSPSRMAGEISYAPATSSHAAYAPSGSASYHNTASASSSNLPRYDPYATARRPTVPSTSSPTIAPTPNTGIRFKQSPFFRVERAVSSVVECPESMSPNDRRSQSLAFSMSNEVILKLTSPNPKYQLRLYCTSSTYYSPSGAFRTMTAPCPIEFPPTCEVRVNGIQLTANLKGLKKKPGTAPPPDLGKSVRMPPGASNRVEIVYVNSQQPVQTKKYYLVVMLVEVTTVDQLVDRLKKGKYKPGSEILAKMAKTASADDDIVAGHQKMSLKCPLSYMRITTPVDHIANDTWLCPVCEKVLNVEDLIVDGYFDNILKQTPESVEDVIVEADGQWHSSDNKYGSLEWRAAHAPTKELAPAKPPSPLKPRSKSPSKPLLNGLTAKNKPRLSNAEIVILDSDDEDEGRVKRELSPSTDIAGVSQSTTTSASQPPRSQTADVIDLTLDSDDDEPRLTIPLTKKRKTTDDIPSPTEQIWKKSRSDSSTSSSATNGISSNASFTEATRYATAQDLAALTVNSGPLSSPASSRYSSSHAAGSQAYQPPMSFLPPPPPSLPRRPSTSSHYSTLPNQYLSRVNGTGPSSPWR
ncbi:E3 SUMO-protein ligase pli1 [Grifola frondosa]|uniref:E3 SUMO-protein ligase pli1 n=1 Tax=Grifola frondosa TaxID=5627 RepID=A0A1C7MTM5_GRIFR|nr:E3 SUMO-protein ligase pli1 [Grifola frondosa]